MATAGTSEAASVTTTSARVDQTGNVCRTVVASGGAQLAPLTTGAGWTDGVGVVAGGDSAAEPASEDCGWPHPTGWTPSPPRTGPGGRRTGRRGPVAGEGLAQVDGEGGHAGQGGDHGGAGHRPDAVDGLVASDLAGVAAGGAGVTRSTGTAGVVAGSAGHHLPW